MTQPDEHPRRSAGVWIKLLIVWGIGLVMWACYLVAIGYIVLKVFG